MYQLFYASTSAKIKKHKFKTTAQNFCYSVAYSLQFKVYRSIIVFIAGPKNLFSNNLWFLLLLFNPG